MNQSTVVLEPCAPELSNDEVSLRVVTLLETLLCESPDLQTRLDEAKRIFIKLNIGIPGLGTYKNRSIAYVDPAVFHGLAIFVREHTDAQIWVGDGTDGISPVEAARERGHLAIAEDMGFHFVSLHEGPYARFDVPKPAMFRWYEFSSVLRDMDMFISVAKMKSHILCGLTMTLKNLFGLPPGPIYGSPRGSLHSPIRLPRVLTDLVQIFDPDICLIDGIIGCNYHQWHGDPVSAGMLLAGDNTVATDAVGARVMGVDPQSAYGTPPFLRTENHLRFASQRGIGPVADSDINLIGEIPKNRRAFSMQGEIEPNTFSDAQLMRRDVQRTAQWYFEDRARFAEQYAGEIVFLAKQKVLLHMPPEELNLKRFFQILKAEGLQFDEIFIKLVGEKEAELREPYTLL